MKTYLQTILMTSAFFCLVACGQSNDYEYLMQHPDALFKAEAECQSQTSMTAAQVEQCKIVSTAATDFRALAQTESSDPQQFGQRVLAAQMACADAKKAVSTAEQSLEKVKASSPSPDALKSAQDAYAVAKKTYQDHQREVKIMLAVISLHSPD